MLEITCNDIYLLAFSGIVLAICLRRLIKFVRWCRTFPPGPWGLPVVGYVLWLGEKPHEEFVNLTKEYGNVFSVNLGSETVVVLNDWKSIEETLVNQPKAFSGKPYSFVLYSLTQGKDIANNNGKVWRAQRRLTKQILKDINTETKSYESRAMDVVRQLIKSLDQVDGKMQCMESVFFGPILKTNWHLVSGTEKKYFKDLKTFEKIVATVFEGLSMNNLLNVFPWLRFIPPYGFGHWTTMRKNKILLSYLRNAVDKHVVNWKKENSLDNFIDCYLDKINEQQAKLGATKASIKEKLVYTLYDFFMSGVDTTNAVCLWGFLLLALNPSIQKRAQDELDEVVGRRRLPTIKDSENLPFTEALIMEIHRVGSINPLISHYTTENTYILNYKIPKGTTVFQNTYAVHHDPKHWNEPNAFNPERFLDEHNKVNAPPYFIPFSTGPRVCLGQSLAEKELKLIFSCLLHQFTFSIPEDSPSPSLEGKLGLTFKPQSYSLHISKRKE